MLSLAEAQDWIAAHAPSKYYATTYRHMEADYLPELCKTINDLSLPTRSQILEIGPGWGTMVMYLASRGHDLMLVDYLALGTCVTASQLTAMSHRFTTRVHYLQIDICDHIMSPQGSYDLAICTQVLPHLKWRADAAISTIHDCLKPNGQAIVSVLDRPAYPHVLPACEHWWQVPKYGEDEPRPETVVTMYDAADLAQLLRRSFAHVEVWRPEDSTCLFARCTRS